MFLFFPVEANVFVDLRCGVHLFQVNYLFSRFVVNLLILLHLFLFLKKKSLLRMIWTNTFVALIECGSFNTNIVCDYYFNGFFRSLVSNKYIALLIDIMAFKFPSSSTSQFVKMRLKYFSQNWYLLNGMWAMAFLTEFFMLLRTQIYISKVFPDMRTKYSIRIPMEMNFMGTALHTELLIKYRLIHNLSQRARL